MRLIRQAFDGGKFIHRQRRLFVGRAVFEHQDDVLKGFVVTISIDMQPITSAIGPDDSTSHSVEPDLQADLDSMRHLNMVVRLQGLKGNRILSGNHSENSQGVMETVIDVRAGSIKQAERIDVNPDSERP